MKGLSAFPGGNAVDLECKYLFYLPVLSYLFSVNIYDEAFLPGTVTALSRVPGQGRSTGLCLKGLRWMVEVDGFNFSLYIIFRNYCTRSLIKHDRVFLE